MARFVVWFSQYDTVSPLSPVISLSCRLVCILLMMALMLQSIGQLSVLLGVRIVARAQARSLVRASAPEMQCSVFHVDHSSQSIAGNTVTWMEDDEFLINGLMYDVVRRYDSANVSVIVALADGADSWLHAALQSEQDRQSRHRAHSLPIRELLSRIDSFKAISPKPDALFRQLTEVLRPSPSLAEPVRPGYELPVDRPPLMS